MHKRKSRADDDGSGAAPAAAAAIDDDVAPDTVIVKHETYDEHAAQWFLLKATASDLGVKWQSKPPAEFEQLKRKVARWCKARGRVEYHLGKNGTADGAGRWIASGGRGLQSFTRPLRGLLAATRYWDVDMENAQPVLLLQLARKRGWVCAAVQEYVDDRNKYFDEIMATGANRDAAKAHCIAIFFGQGKGKTIEAGLPPFFVDRLQPELAQLRANITNHADYANLRRTLERAKRRKDGGGQAANASLSLAAYVLQTEERKCLLAIERELRRNGRDLDTYIHDGGLVRKQDGETAFPQDLLRKCEKAVLDDTGYAVRLVVKPLCVDVKIPPGALDAMKPQQHLAAWQRAHQVAYVQSRDTYTYWNATTARLELVTRAHLLNLFENDSFEKARMSATGDVTPQKVSTVKEWLAWGERATYGDAGFWPSAAEQHERDGVLNMFRGCAYERVLADASVVAAAPDSEPVKLVDELLVYVCGGVQEAAYFQNAMAAKLQYPMTPPRLSLVFNGASGLGKDSLCDWIGERVLGKALYLSTKNPQRDVFGPFNGLAENKLLIKMEEVEGASFSGAWERYKALVTSGNLQVNSKGKDQREVESFTLWMMTTNRDSVPVEADDRRTVVFQATEHEHKQEKAWFDKVHAALAQPGVVKHVVHKWLHLDVSRFDPVGERPISRLHQAACAAAVPRVMQFLCEQAVAKDDGDVAAAVDAVTYGHGVADADADVDARRKATRNSAQQPSAREASHEFVSLSGFHGRYSAWHMEVHGKGPHETLSTFNSKLKTELGSGRTPLVGEACSPLMEKRTADTRGWVINRESLRAWLQGKGYLAKTQATAALANEVVTEDPAEVVAAYA